MTLLTNILQVLFSLSGIVFGLALTYIAPEEIQPGKKYFIFLKRILFVLISGTIIYSFAVSINVPLLLLSLAFLLPLFMVDFKIKRKEAYWLHYLFFVIAYFFISEVQLKIILASLIFLYGFPVGSLLKGDGDKP